MAIYTVYFGFLISVIIPGVNFNIILKNQLNSSWVNGIKIVIGSTIAELVHVTYTYFGYGGLIVHSVILKKLISSLLILFLLFFAFYRGEIQFFPKSNYGYYLKGFFINILNPRAAVFYLSVLSVLNKNLDIYFTYFLYFPIIVLIIESSYVMLFNYSFITKTIIKYKRYFLKFNSGFFIILAVFLFLDIININL
jgi:threonine/homoserine/homoserine lactone efflux protein